MFKNYLITALRNLKKNKVFAFINILGLALGIGCSLVIFKVIMYELSYDKHQENLNNIYRVSRLSIYPDFLDKGMGSPNPLGPAIKADYPEIKEVVRTFYIGDAQINVEREDGELDKFLFDEGVAFTEKTFFKVFTVEWIAGDKNTALSEPYTAVISKSMAQKLFHLSENEVRSAIGKSIRYEKDFKIVGIVGDPPSTTNLPFEILLNFENQDIANPYYYEGTNWNSTSSATNTYVLVNEGFDIEAFDLKLIETVRKYYDEEETTRRKFIPQPFATLHFDKEHGAYKETISISFIYALGIIALFLVLTACINFINLATAQAANRAKEIGIRKAIGGLSTQLIAQFMAEISLIVLVAMIVGLAIAEMGFIALEDIIGYRITLDFVNDLPALAYLFILFITVTVVSGFYPSVLLSRMNTILALKSKITAKRNSGGLSLRKGLVIFQFAISQFLIIGTLVVSAQMKYFNEKDLGFDQEAIVNADVPSLDKMKLERFKNLVLASPRIKDITFALSQPTGNSNSMSNFNYAPLNSESSYRANFKGCDTNYLEFFGLKLLAGRNLRKTDSTLNIVINRRIADLMGFKDNYEAVIGENLQTGWNGDKKVVGVMDDFHTQSLSGEIDYTILIYEPRIFYSMSFKISSMTESKEALADFSSAWEEIYPEDVVDYQFYDEALAEEYETEQRVFSLLRIFSLISILIGCLGLYGLISFIAINRTKEIGVRKALGASIFTILKLFSKEMLTLTAIAFFVAAPFAYFVMSGWLEDYAYRISLGFEFFALAFGITLVIAALTISHRSISTAMINPAQTLKDE
ncbi:MAG: ABC transporter permease [Cyclobacteriaceae bacterium]